MKKTITFMSMFLGIGAIGMFLLASVLNFSLGWTIGVGMLIVAATIALVIAFIEGNGGNKEGDEGNNIGSYRMPRT